MIYYQRSGIPPEQVILPDEVEEMDVDQVVPPGDATDGNNFRQKVLAAERVLIAHGDGPSFPRRFNKDVFRKLCEDRELDTGGQKKELYARLVAWVCRS